MRKIKIMIWYESQISERNNVDKKWRQIMEAYTLDWQKGQLIQDRMQEADYKRISDKK